MNERDRESKYVGAVSAKTDVAASLAGKINLPQIQIVVRWALSDYGNLENLFRLVDSADRQIGINALWCLTHVQKRDGDWLQSRQGDLIDMLLAETHTGRKRMLLQLLREQDYNPETIRTDFLDFCLVKINAECEPYAIRCFCMYCAFKMCRFYAELIAELEERLDMLAQQSLSPGLMSALRTTRKRIKANRVGK